MQKQHVYTQTTIDESL